jgi:hypothetical protein
MTFKQASAFKFPFGKHKGMTLDSIASTDDGLRYLDWARGLDNLYPETRQALTAYLDDPSIAKDLDVALKHGKE